MKKYKSLLFSVLFGITAVVSPIFDVSAASEQASITRAQAEQRALNMINLTWTYSNSKNGTLSSDYVSLVTQPSQFSNLTTSQVTGIPYDWGGGDGLDSISVGAPWTNFLDAINKGAYAGNVNITAGQQYVPTTAGIDCSGFVQATFNIQDYKISTSTMFDKYFTKINLNDIKHMDILDRPGDHVVIFDRWGTLNGVQGAYTYESTPDQAFGGIQGAKQYFLTMADLNNGYIAGRYINIIEDNSNASTLPHPVNAETFAQIVNVNSYANLRSSSSTSSNIISTVPKNTVVYLISYSNGWYQLKYNGQVGWVYGTLIAPLNNGNYITVNNSTYQVNIRTNPSTTSSNIVGVLSQGQYAQVLDYSPDGTWMKININGVQGWSYGKYLSYIN
ncbi:SH3 domain-containing protein [Clostridiaceae bacterium UIB06]|uniref:SH3 domain-containing protein n=1 Tax=Clostridium thailandense TaxID=2794346 RepID=A0A949X3B9_9CLOT|nr:SH3 domain-containing protein [Clostridium thailandense]MBV7274309.1 SH3 domain-containing protein [Clostridium thailandense]MCH5136209.1 SH3 domain-containing protein [Clostridiaceae bacterium UIB06]